MSHGSGYTRLPEGQYIRLLQVKKVGNVDDDCYLECSLDVKLLGSETVPYIALSYTWGSPVRGADWEAKYDIENGVRTLVSHDGGPPKALTIGRNLYEALVQIHDSHWKSFIWADAICIDQSNTTERSVQVQMMGDVYHKAHQVVAWLGVVEHEDQSRELARILGPFLQYVRKWRQEHPGEDGPYALSTQDDMARLGSDVTFPLTMFNEINRIVEFRRYDTRCWILQEILLARDVVLLLGSFSFNLDDEYELRTWHKKGILFIAASIGVKSHMVRGSVMNAVNDVVYMLRNDQSYKQPQAAKDGVDLLSFIFGADSEQARNLAWLEFLLGANLDLEVTNPRDSIYSVLGLYRSVTQGRSRLVVTPNYDASPEDVFISLTVQLLTHLPYMTIFSLLPRHEHRKLRGLPSWVPDLSVRAGGRACPLPLQYPRCSHTPGIGAFDAHPSREMCATDLDIDGDELKLQGHYCASISEILRWRPITGAEGREGRDPDIAKPAIQSLRDFRTLLRWAVVLGPMYAGRSVLEALRQLLTLEEPASGELRVDQMQRFERYLKVLLLVYVDRATPGVFVPASEENSLMNDMKVLLDQLHVRHNLFTTSDLIPAAAVYQVTEQEPSGSQFVADLKMLSEFPSEQTLYRDMFMSSNGHLGLCPQGTRPGDQVWILCRARLPQILRPLPGDKSGRFLILGEAYVQDGMDGQLMRGVAGPVQSIVLC